jgi:acetyl esterase/lipase
MPDITAMLSSAFPGKRRVAIALGSAVVCLGGIAAGMAYAETTIVETNMVDQVSDTQIQFSPEDRLADVISHPVFGDFGQHLMPRPGQAPRPEMTLGDFGTLLPYHSNVHPEEIATTLERLAEDAQQGHQVFYPIYSKDEVDADPAKAETGLFLLRGRPGAPFAIIAPGGGFSYVGTVHEGLPYAVAISEMGYNAFVIRYRVGMGQQAATQDMARAIEFVFDNASELGTSTDGYSVWGSSAGARMAALIGSHGPSAFGASDLPGPASVIMAYTSHSDIGTAEPQTYVIVGERDGIAPPSAMQRRVEVLRRMGTKVEFRIVPDVGHGFGSGQGTPAQGWVEDAVNFWRASVS